MEEARLQRVLRQQLQTEALLGVDAVPVARHQPPPVSPATPTPAPALPLGSAPKLTRDQKLAVLEAMDRDEVQGCRRCGLCQSRTRTVFGEGDPDAALMFIGEGPGQNEDEQGRPFVGRAGELLNRMIVAMGLAREQVFIANAVKCRPPNNRMPTPQEVDACSDYLRRQIMTIQPKVIVTLGGPATKLMLDTKLGITALRGTWHTFEGLAAQGIRIPVMPTFHPAFVLRAYTPDNRRKVWSDLQQVMAKLGEFGG